MAPKRESRLPSSSSRIEFVSVHEEKSCRGRVSRQCLIRAGLAVGLSVVLIVVIVVLMMVLLRTDSKKPSPTKETNSCSFSEEAKRVKLDTFLEKLRDNFQRHHPSFIGLKPGVTSTEVREIYRPYDFRPEAIKNTTDVGLALYNELRADVVDKVDERKLKLRERKAIHVASRILKEVFGWSPYEANYYSGDWLLGPNIFCWQPICETLVQLQLVLPYFKPSSLKDIQTLLDILKQHEDSIHQYNANLQLAAKTGMVRPLEACTAGVREFKMRFQAISLRNETGIMETQMAKDVLKAGYLDHLKPETRKTWTRLHNETVEESLRRAITEYLGKPLNRLIRFLETDYIRHCVPSNVSSGLSSLPLPYVCVDGVVTNQPTNQTLPSGEKLNGKEAYNKLISVFTTLDISPQKLKETAQERLDRLLYQAISLAKEYTNESNDTEAINKFRAELSRPEMFFNRKSFPSNESDESAFSKCATEKGARAFCPSRWKAMQEWMKATAKTMDYLKPQLSQLFYTNGPMKTVPDCAIRVAPWFHSEAVYHSYYESRSPNCTVNSALQLLPFFVDNYGPKFTEWTTTAHEQLPGHHLEVRGYIENFRSKCDDTISWLSWPNYFPGFTEGWATYAEYPVMANDTDIYSNTTDKKALRQKYGLLKYQILAALRSLCDIQINYYGMLRNEAIRLYDKYAWETSNMASKDITRCQSTPGAVTSYMIGQMTFLKARQLMEKSRGSGFSLPEFHYEVLRQGEIPLEYLIKYINDLCKR